MRRLFMLLTCVLGIGCANAEPIDETSFFDQWWILSGTEEVLKEYEMTYCFYPDSNGEIVFQDINFYYEEEVYYWTEISINTYDIEGFATVEVAERAETTFIPDDWNLTFRVFPLTSKAVAIPCLIFNEE